MTTLELKGGMMEMITKVQDKSALERLYRIISEFIIQNLDDTDGWDALTPEQRAEIEDAFAESLHPQNLVSHEAMMKKYEKWLAR